jgi:hypothetical protein
MASPLEKPKTDILISGTGAFSGRIALDLAATSQEPLHVVIAGRNRDRLIWLKTACNARASMFSKPITFDTYEIDLVKEGATEQLIADTRPTIAVQGASIQTSSVISDTGNQWTALVAEGGLSATAVFQALISSRMARSISKFSPETALINCGFPDVVNSIISALGFNVLSGTGNVAILSNVFAGAKGITDQARIQVIAHYQNLAAWRRPSSERVGTRPCRVFIDGNEVADVFKEFEGVKLTTEPAIEISGASGVTLIAAYAANKPWTGHVPGPNGLPGGYPVKLQDRVLHLNLPHSVTEQEAIAWNTSFEEEKGLIIRNGRVEYTGDLKTALTCHGFRYADGFEVADLEEFCADMLKLRDTLSQQKY